MPIVTVSMYSGRTQREKDRLAEAMMAEDIAKILNRKKEEVIIAFQEAPPRKLVFLRYSSIILLHFLCRR
jgi:4-oxalocrotonate tautomerase